MTLADADQNSIFTEGTCKGTRGRGGWAAVFYQDGKRRILSGNDRSTTSNRMELVAAIKGLQATPELRSVVVHSDSQYLINTMNRGWERNSNLDLWAQLDRIQESRNVTWKWVTSRQRSPGNEIANRVASMEAGLFQTEGDNPPRRRAPAMTGKPRHKRHTGGKRPGNSVRRPKRS